MQGPQIHTHGQMKMAQDIRKKLQGGEVLEKGMGSFQGKGRRGCKNPRSQGYGGPEED